MKRFMLIGFLALLCVLPARAQTTLVTGTVTDPNGLPYSGAQVKAQLVSSTGPLSGQPTVTVSSNAQCASAGQGSAPCQIPFPGTAGPIAADVNGAFTLALQDNSLVTPAGTQWLFTVTETPGIPPPAGTGPQTFSVAITITGASQSVSGTLSAAAPALSKTSGGVNPATPTSALPEQAHLIGAYWLMPTESACNPTDYSGRGNNGIGCVSNTPAQLAGTGGLSCVWNGTAVKLPPALNSAKTIAVFVVATGLINAYQAPIAGNGNGAQGHFIGLNINNVYPGLGSTGWTHALGTTSFFDKTGATGTLGFLGNASPTFPSLFTLVSDPSFDVMYLNDGQIGQSTSAGSQGAQDRGNYQLCGTAAFSGYSQNSYFNGKLYAAFLWDVELTATEVASASTTVNNAMQARGLSLACGTASQSWCSITNPYVAVYGDSLTSGIDATGLTFSNAPQPPTLLNGALSGQPLGTSLFLNTSSICKGNIAANTPGNIFGVWSGTDDSGNPTGSSLTGYLITMAQTCHAAGSQFVAGTMIDRTTEEARKNDYDANILANANQFDAIADFAAWANLGADGASTNATNFPDGTHPAQFLNYNEIIPTWQAAFNHIYGAKGFSTATTYGSAAAAATATTAGSETGNIITLTFAATPANCQKGSLIVTAGITPAGYNSDSGAGRPAAWQILSRTATQVTFYTGATGLGVITVQGTGVCPAQQDHDTYAILNFGAGNWTLQPCELWAGLTVHIKNTNAAGSTLVPFGSETIDNATVAAHSQAAIQSVRGSTAAAGCQWLTTQ